MKKRLIGIVASMVVFIAVFGLIAIAPVQAQTYTVWGQVFDTDGVTPVDGVDVTVTDLDTADSLPYVTTGGGWYQAVFGPPGTAYPVNIGDTLQISATYGNLINTTTVTATGTPQQVDLILREKAIPPIIQFIPPTPANNSINTTGYVTVRVNVTDPDKDGISVVLLNWNGVNETMHNIAPDIFSVTKANLQKGIYSFNVYANDICDNWGVSETRIVNVTMVQIEFTNNFASGYNMMGIPINDTSVANASSLIAKIGANCLEVSKWDKGTQKWKSYSAGMPPTFDFGIGGSEGCFVRMADATTVIFTGIGWESPFVVSLVTGYNMISLPLNDTSATSASLLIAKIGANCQEVSKWDKGTQKWKSYSAGMPPTFDFGIGGGEGCFVRMNAPADVTFEGEPWHD